MVGNAKLHRVLLVLALSFCVRVVYSAPIVIFKADDLIDPSSNAWQRFFNVVQTQNIKASVGIIAKNFVANAQNIGIVRGLYNDGQIEFWNHGYDHSSYKIPAVMPFNMSVDYDGDRLSDHAVKADDGRWMIDYAHNGLGTWDVIYYGYGDASAYAVPADYDGDGKADLSVKVVDGRWLIDYAYDGFGVWNAVHYGYGDGSVSAVPADYDGDGKADLSVKTIDGHWYIDYATNGFSMWDIVRSDYGGAYAKAVPADYDGDGKADLSVKLDDGRWFIDYAANSFNGWDLIVPAQADPQAIVMTEFWGLGSSNSGNPNSYNPQYDHLVLAQNLFSSVLQVSSYSFGAPFNRTNGNTVVAIDRIGGIKVWMCYSVMEVCSSSDPSKRILWFSLLIESWSPYAFDANPIYNNWGSLSQKDYLVIQIHPAQWNASNMGESKFLQLVSFLKSKGVIFMLPYVYHSTRL